MKKKSSSLKRKRKQQKTKKKKHNMNNKWNKIIQKTKIGQSITQKPDRIFSKLKNTTIFEEVMML